jgi:cytidylate kinase
VFLTASSAERAHRRSRQLADTGHAVAVDEVREGLCDATKPIPRVDAGPLDRASDAHLLDTTGLTVDEVVDRIVALWEDSDEHTAR